MSVDVIVGLQRGDEGKGRFVDLEASEYDVVARGNGGSNAGHTVVPEGLAPIALHQVPSGIACPDKVNVIGNGVYLDPRRLAAEIDELRAAGIEVTRANLLISDIAHLVMPHHVALDELREDSSTRQGSTKSGIAYVASDKYLREGVRVESISDPKALYELAYEGLSRVRQVRWRQRGLRSRLREEASDWTDAARRVEHYAADTVEALNNRIGRGDRILAEGAQAFWLDINHGMYPAVTSSSTTVSGLLDGLGIAPKHLGRVTGVAKVVKSHVGGGPFVTEITDEQLASTIRGPRGEADSEYGATTKRPRRIGYPDLPELRSAIRVNGVDELVLSKMDHVSRFGRTILVASLYQHNGALRLTAPSSAIELETCRPVYVAMDTWGDIGDVRSYGELPAEAAEFVEFIEDQLEVGISKLGVGPERNQVIVR